MTTPNTNPGYAALAGIVSDLVAHPATANASLATMTSEELATLKRVALAELCPGLATRIDAVINSRSSSPFAAKPDDYREAVARVLKAWDEHEDWPNSTRSKWEQWRSLHNSMVALKAAHERGRT